MHILTSHPSKQWQTAIKQPYIPIAGRLRLAAMAGHMQHDLVVARRAALIDLLAEGKPLMRRAIWERVERALGQPCWGKRPQETLLRDLNVLRDGGIRIAYSRQASVEGYYLQYPAIEKSSESFTEPALPALILDRLRSQSVVQKLAAAFALADFALQQKRLILTRQQPDWSAEKVNQTARQQVFGTPLRTSL